MATKPKLYFVNRKTKEAAAIRITEKALEPYLLQQANATNVQEIFQCITDLCAAFNLNHFGKGEDWRKWNIPYEFEGYATLALPKYQSYIAGHSEQNSQLLWLFFLMESRFLEAGDPARVDILKRNQRDNPELRISIGDIYYEFPNFFANVAWFQLPEITIP